MELYLLITENVRVAFYNAFLTVTPFAGTPH